MNNETGNSCPMPSCPDNYGTMPSCAGLAVPYVPFQQTGSKQYSQNDALSNGTLFPGLNLPFHLKVEGSALPSTPSWSSGPGRFAGCRGAGHLTSTSHPARDTEAFELFKQYSAMEQSAKAAYEAKFGPITKTSAAAGSSYRWLQDPWPWNFGQ